MCVHNNKVREDDNDDYVDKDDDDGNDRLNANSCTAILKKFSSL
jgi:hypothetical protein